jgi:hypothetical protein
MSYDIEQFSPASGRKIKEDGSTVNTANLASNINDAIGAKADSAITDSSASGTFMSFMKGILATIKSVISSNKVQVDVKTQVALSSVNDSVTAAQSTHDNLNCNANIQQNNTDITSGNPLYTQAEDGKNVTLGAKADARSTATDTTAITAMQVLKQISYMLQNPAAVNVTQSTHDNLNLNSNIQINNTDVSTTNPVNVTGNSGIVASSHTRPDNTTAYTAGDVVGTDAATNLSWTNVNSANGKTVIITGVSLEVDVNAVPSGMSTFRLHIYTSAPTAIADNSAYNLPSGDRTKYAGWIDIDTPTDLGDTLFARMNNVNFEIAPAVRTLYGMLETRGAYTPSSQTVKTVTLYAVEV